MIHKATPRRRVAVATYPTGDFGNDSVGHYHSNSSSGDDLSIRKPGMAGGPSGPAFELDGKHPTSSSSVDILDGSEIFQLSLGQSIDGGGYLSRHVDDHQPAFDPSHPPPPPPPFMVQDTLNRFDSVGLQPHPTTTLPLSLNSTTTTTTLSHHHKMTLNSNHHHPRRIDPEPPSDPVDELNKRMSID